MIGDWLTLARRPLPLGPDQTARFLPWVFALLVYVAGLGGVGLIVFNDSLRAFGHLVATTLTLQVPADASNARVETVLALLRQTHGIVSVHLLEPAETARLLEPWFGPSVSLDELPVPRLIDLRIDPEGATDVATLRRQLASVVPDARLDDQRQWPQGMRAAARRIEDILAAGITVALLLIAVSAVFAVRTRLTSSRSITELLHVLGAADPAIARGFAIGSLRLGLLGGLIGAVAVLLTILALSGAGSVVQLPAAPGMTRAANGVAASGIVDWRVWAILIGVVPIAGLIAMASAWVAVMRRLAGMP
jgi:cell division transport system permease protein